MPPKADVFHHFITLIPKILSEHFPTLFDSPYIPSTAKGIQYESYHTLVGVTGLEELQMLDDSIHTIDLMLITHCVSYTSAYIQQENHLVMLIMILSDGPFLPQL